MSTMMAMLGLSVRTPIEMCEVQLFPALAEVEINLLLHLLLKLHPCNGADAVQTLLEVRQLYTTRCFYQILGHCPRVSGPKAAK